MHGLFTIAKKYVHYYLTASNGHGHGIHSPFVFSFIKNVLTDKKKYNVYKHIEAQRKRLLNDEQAIEVKDLGAGSMEYNTSQRRVKNIASSSLKPKKYAQLLFRIVQHYQCQNVVELGTSLGITTAYLASATHRPQVTTLEGSPAISKVAEQTFAALQLLNIKPIIGNFNDTLPQWLAHTNTVDFVFIDGNHRKAPTLQYFSLLLTKANSKTIFIFDDIYWSAEMEQAWGQIKSHPQVRLSINLFFIGIVFIDPIFLVKQHYTIRF